MQFYYVIADPKVAEQHIYTKFPNHNSFQVTSDFTQKLAITHLAIKIDSQFTHHVVAIEKVAE